MKTVNNLFDKIIDKENLRLAIHNASRGRKHRRDVIDTLNNEDKFIEELYHPLSLGLWWPPLMHNVKVINDGTQAKKREIVCPTFEEHVVHHAILQVCKPVFLSRFYKHSYSSVPGYGGTENMVKYIRSIFRDKNTKNYKYFVKLDIRKFFDSVCPETVYDALRRIIRDKKLLDLFHLILTFNARKNPETEKINTNGIPIGLYTSQWFANILLTPLDNFIKDHGNKAIPYYIRYNDDMLLIGSNKRKLNRLAHDIQDYLLSIGLQLKQEIQVHQTSKVKINYVGAQIDFNTKTIKMVARTFLKQRKFCLKMSDKINNRFKKANIIEARKILIYLARARNYDMHDFVTSLRLKKKPLKKIISKYDKAHKYRRHNTNGTIQSVG